MCEVSDLEGCDVWSERVVKARKKHRCSACRAMIEPGSPYGKHFSVYDGSITSEAICADCWFSRQQFEDEHQIGIVPSYLIEFLRDCIIDNRDHNDKWRPVLAGVLKRKRAAERVAA